MTEEEMISKKNLEEAYGKAPDLDFSGIKNAKAAKITKSVSSDIETKIKEDSKKVQKNKFCFTEEHEVKLPCACIYKDFEDEDIKNGIVKLSPMSLADEDILTNQSYMKNGSTFTKLLNSCMSNNFDAKNFLPYDLYYLLYVLRQITYGEDYSFKINCDCGRTFDYEVDLSEVEFAELTDGDFSKIIKLPVSKYTLDMNVPTIGNEETRNKIFKKYEDDDEISDTILNYIVRTNVIYDDKGEPLNPNDYGEFYKALPGKDRAEISKAFKYVEELEIPQVTAVCPKCGEEIKIEIPFNKEFFRY